MLIGASDVHEVAEQVVPLILRPAQSFNRIGPYINGKAIGQDDQPALRVTGQVLSNW